MMRTLDTELRDETMGKPTGFLEFPRELPMAHSPIERTRSWDEFHGHADEALLRQQGARCMDCGVPFCHTGAVIEGMAAGCPINNLIPEWNDLVYRGLWREALDRLHMYGIPNMKLDKHYVQRRVDLMAAEGVVFITNCEVGKDMPARKLREDFDAVVLCGGATKPNDFFAKTEGRNLQGIHFAMEF